MDFGKLTNIDLAEIDFSLKEEPKENMAILAGSIHETPGVYVGCPKWGRPEWIGNLYPRRIKEKEYPAEYARHFNSLELNATHYKIYESHTIEKWVAAVGDHNFIFCPRMYKGITHAGSLHDKGDLTKTFLNSLSHFKGHLGPIFIQLSETFRPNRSEELFDFLSSLPNNGFQFFVEIRNPDWFVGPIFNELCDGLHKLNIGLVIVDTAGRRDIVHMRLAGPKAFIRFSAVSVPAIDYARLDAWVERIKYWLSAGLKELYFFIHANDESQIPALTAYLVNRLNNECHLDLKTPKLLTIENVV